MINIDEKPSIVNTVNDIRERLFASNFQPIPVQTGCKESYQKGWHTTIGISGSATVDALNTGILCTGLRAVDIDCDDPQDAEKIYKIAVERWPDAPVRSRPNSPRKLLMLRAAEGTPGKRAIQGAGHSKERSRAVEILGNRNFFVAFGTHTSGADYAWNLVPGSDFDRDDLPEVSEQEISEFIAECAAIIEAPEERKSALGDGKPKTPKELSAHDPEWLQKLVLETSEHSLSESEWADIIRALKGAFSKRLDLGYEAARHITEKWEGGFTSDDALETKWDAASPLYIGEKRVLDYCRNQGVDTAAYEAAAALAAAQDAFDAEPPPPHDDITPPATRKRFQSRQVSEFNLDATPELIAGWIGHGELAAMIGAPSAGKTAIAAGMAVSLATGKPWMGCAVERGATLCS